MSYTHVYPKGHMIVSWNRILTHTAVIDIILALF